MSVKRGQHFHGAAWYWRGRSLYGRGRPGHLQIGILESSWSRRERYVELVARVRRQRNDDAASGRRDNLTLAIEVQRFTRPKGYDVL